MKYSKSACVLGCALLFAATPIFADNISDLFNTGVDASGVPLVGSGVTDSHYVIVSGPGPDIYPVNAVASNCCYFADQPSGTNGESRWITVTGGSNAGSGTYDFQTTFSLTGLDETTAEITGRFAGDNHIIETLLNGNVIAGATTDTFSAYTAFSIPVGSAFVAGLNTLDFLVKDDGAPMSLRVDQLSGTASPAESGGGGGTVGAVPEPGTIFLLATSCIAIFAFQFRSKRRLN